MDDPPKQPKTLTERLSLLLTIHATLREDVRSNRALLFSAVVVCFTIPLSAIAVQNPSVFQATRLWSVLPFSSTIIDVLPQPSKVIFIFWALGVFLVMPGIKGLFPSMSTADETWAKKRVEDVVNSLLDEDVDLALNGLADAIREEHSRLDSLARARKWILGALFMFLLCVTVEFAVILF